MAPSGSLSPVSVLNFLEEEQPLTIRRETRKLCLSLEEDDDQQYQEPPKKSARRSLNLRHRSVCEQTVQWLATQTHSPVMEPENGNNPLEELWLGPVFENSETILTALRTLPPTIRHLDLDLRNALEFLPQALEVLFHPKRHHVTSLSLRFFGDSGAKELAKWLPHHSQLKRLDLQGNRIGARGVKALVGALSQPQICLEQLNLSCNCIMDVQALRNLLLSTTTMKSLDLSFNWIGDNGISTLCDGLRENKSLRHFNVFGCQRIGSAGLQALLNCVKDRNTSLQQLTIQAVGGRGRELHQELLHWLAMNRAGRCLFTRADTVPLSVWPTVLERRNEDPTALYFLLRQGGPVQFFTRPPN